jgi:hypothetical protein
MGKRLSQVLGVLAALVGVAALAVLVYASRGWIWDALMSPLGGLVAKVLFTGKAVKIIVGVGLAVAAAVLAIRKKMRGDQAESTAPAETNAPAGEGAEAPVFRPPDPDEPQVSRDGDRSAGVDAAAPVPAAPPAAPIAPSVPGAPSVQDQARAR